MSELDDLKHLWEYKLTFVEKAFLITMAVGLLGFIFTGEDELAFIGLGSFILLMPTMHILHN